MNLFFFIFFLACRVSGVQGDGVKREKIILKIKKKFLEYFKCCVVYVFSFYGVRSKTSSCFFGRSEFLLVEYLFVVWIIGSFGDFRVWGRGIFFFWQMRVFLIILIRELGFCKISFGKFLQFGECSFFIWNSVV